MTPDQVEAVIAEVAPEMGCARRTKRASLQPRADHASHGPVASVHEVCRPNRRVRRTRGKSDPIDAEAAARAVLAGHDLIDPKSVLAVGESLRQLRATRRSAVKARTQAANLIHALLLTAPPELRTNLDQPHLPETVALCARLRPSPTHSPREACKRSLRCAARRWLHLNAEASELSQNIAELVTQDAPALLEVFGVGPDVAAALLITAGGNPDRMRNEASFAALCGISPIPASSGKTHRHRLNRGGDRQANAAIHVIALALAVTTPAPRPTSTNAPLKASAPATSPDA